MFIGFSVGLPALFQFLPSLRIFSSCFYHKNLSSHFLSRFWHECYTFKGLWLRSFTKTIFKLEQYFNTVSEISSHRQGSTGACLLIYLNPLYFLLCHGAFIRSTNIWKWQVFSKAISRISTKFRWLCFERRRWSGTFISFHYFNFILTQGGTSFRNNTLLFIDSNESFFSGWFMKWKIYKIASKHCIGNCKKLKLNINNY